MVVVWNQIYPEGCHTLRVYLTGFIMIRVGCMALSRSIQVSVSGTKPRFHTIKKKSIYDVSHYLLNIIPGFDGYTPTRLCLNWLHVQRHSLNIVGVYKIHQSRYKEHKKYGRTDWKTGSIERCSKLE